MDGTGSGEGGHRCRLSVVARPDRRRTTNTAARPTGRHVGGAGRSVELDRGRLGCGRLGAIRSRCRPRPLGSRRAARHPPTGRRHRRRPPRSSMDEDPTHARRAARGRLLRPRQDDHRDVVGHGLLPPVPRRGPAHAALGPAHRVRAAALPARRRRRGPDGAPARAAVADGRRLGRVAGVLDRRRDAARVDRPDGVRGGRRAHRGAPRGGPGRRGGVRVGRRGGRADRRDPRRGPRHRDPDERGRRPVHGRDRLLRLRGEQGVGHPGARRRSRATTSTPATRTRTRSRTPRCSARSATRSP